MQLGDREVAEKNYRDGATLGDLVGLADGAVGGERLRLSGGSLTVDGGCSETALATRARGGARVQALSSSESDGRPATWWERRCRDLIFRQLKSLRSGSLTVIDRDGEWRFGPSTAEDGRDSGQPSVILRVRQPSAYRKIVTGGDLGFAEALIAGELECEALVGLLRMMIVQAQTQSERVAGQGLVRRMWSNARHWLRRNHRANSRRNIQAHYDLSNDFFALWLDPTMCYSSGVFSGLAATDGPSGLEWHSPCSLEQASLQKMDRLCQKLELSPQDHLLEIGCGWGGLAIHAASRYGCRVTGVTLSPAQLQLAQERVQKAGLSELIHLELRDYRDIDGTFDKLVSVEMIEAVGHQYLDQYFRTCCRLLKPDGRMVLQGITIGDQRYAQYLKQVDFIREYIFPGGCLISQSAMLQSIARGTDFRLTHLEDIGQHYAETLRRWRTAFHESWPQIEALGFDDTFFRMWDYYLAYCEAGFTEGHVGTVQVVLDRQRQTAPVPWPIGGGCDPSPQPWSNPRAAGRESNKSWDRYAEESQ